MIIIFFFKQKTSYVMESRYWSSDVCSSDLIIIHLIYYQGCNNLKILRQPKKHFQIQIYFGPQSKTDVYFDKSMHEKFENAFLFSNRGHIDCSYWACLHLALTCVFGDQMMFGFHMKSQVLVCAGDGIV